MSKRKNSHHFRYTKGFEILAELFKRGCFSEDENVSKSILQEHFHMRRNTISGCVTYLLENSYIDYNSRGGKIWLTQHGINTYERVSGQESGLMILKDCPECGNRFTIKKSNPSKLCSIACIDRHYQKKLKEYEKTIA